MIAFAFWLAFFSLLPVLYWVFKMMFDRLRFALTSKHHLVLENIDTEGTVRRDVVDVSSDDEFYKIAMTAIRAGRTIKGGAFE